MSGLEGLDPKDTEEVDPRFIPHEELDEEIPDNEADAGDDDGPI